MTFFHSEVWSVGGNSSEGIRRPSSTERGVAAILFVLIILGSMIMVTGISSWIGVQRRGDTQMRVASKELLMAQLAIQDMRLRLIQGTGTLSTVCTTPSNQTFSYSLENGYTVTVSLVCNPITP